ncbi:hypothetical protein [Arthrobacter sp. 31Y]|uniref:hypothetical protein n=1 Tax=Arthrobacter sp. 31Y TaxID=1115632 RepID=UPI0004645311|nr:hypothetical protein [Arthrobacter sp. 31Y]
MDTGVAWVVAIISTITLVRSYLDIFAKSKEALLAHAKDRKEQPPVVEPTTRKEKMEYASHFLGILAAFLGMSVACINIGGQDKAGAGIAAALFVLLFIAPWVSTYLSKRVQDKATT